MASGEERVNTSERTKELKRRRHRKKKLLKLHARIKTAKGGELESLRQKLFRITPGATVLLENWKIDG